MNTPNNNIEDLSFSEMNSAEQREYLQEQNPDMLAMCFSLLSDDGGYTLKSNDSVLCCYPNQLTDGQIELPENFDKGNIVILDMGALRKKEIKIIGGNALSMNFLENPVLLSPGVIEYWEGENGKKYTQTVLRDGGKTTSDSGITSLADANQRTTTAGRNFSGDLFEDIEIENAEESPFLMINEQGEYVLVTNDLDYVSYLKHSIEGYLEKKYLSPADENYEEVKKAFERKFSGVGYDDLGNILQDIVENNRFEAYESEEGEIDGIKQTQIKLGENTGNFYVFHDEENNTVEYRSIRKITNFPEDLKSVGRLPLRLFLESSNQDPSLHKIENIGNYGVKSPNLVPTIEDFRKKIRKTVG